MKVYNQIFSINGNVITVKAQDVQYGELAMVYSRYEVSLAEVIRLENEFVFLQVYKGSKGISTQDQVKFLGHSLQVHFSDNILGRIFDGKGDALDGGPEFSGSFISARSPVVNPCQRMIPDKIVRTNIPMIDMFNTLVESQKIPIFSVSGEPYNQLIARIAIQAEVDIVVLGGIGLRYRDYLFLREELEASGVLSRSVLFINTAQDSIVESLLVPDLSLSIAERFALEGKKVLVLLNDMTNFSNALKEISIIMEQVPSNRGYPGDLYSQLAARYEKAVNFKNSGSLTLLSITTLPGDDITHPVPDNTGYITEGQFYLRNGRIEPFGSLSRLKQFVNGKTRDDHRGLMDAMIKLYALYKESEEKKIMGFHLSDWDHKLLKYGVLFENKMMNLAVKLSLEDSLDLGWALLKTCFNKEEILLPSDLINKYWDMV